MDIILVFLDCHHCDLFLSSQWLRRMVAVGVSCAPDLNSHSLECVETVWRETWTRKSYVEGQVLIIALRGRNDLGLFLFFQFGKRNLIMFGSNSLFKSTWIIIKITCLNYQKITSESCHGSSSSTFLVVELQMKCLLFKKRCLSACALAPARLSVKFHGKTSAQILKYSTSS